MQVIKVEKNKDDNLHYVHIEHNGMKAYYILEHSLIMSEFTEEIEHFKKVFFYNTEVDWTDVMSDEEALDVFYEYNILMNEEHQKLIEEKEKEYLESITTLEDDEDITYEPSGMDSDFINRIDANL